MRIWHAYTDIKTKLVRSELMRKRESRYRRSLHENPSATRCMFRDFIVWQEIGVGADLDMMCEWGWMVQ
jgi:hypothetical protein